MDPFYPLKLLVDWLVFDVMMFNKETIMAQAVNFFIYDSVKILILLIIIIFIVSLIRSYLPPEKIRTILIHKNRYISHLLASLLGIITPFCSCSAIPLFLGFIQAGVPLGVTFTFLISSPMINEVALVLLLASFGWKIALIYVISGLIISNFSGILISKLKMEGLVQSFVYKSSITNQIDLPEMKWRQRISYAKSYTFDIVKKVWIYIIIGVGLGAFIHGYIPTELLAQYAGNDKWYAVPLAVLVGIPLYSNAAGVIPLISSLTEKGLAMGTTLAFMMAVTALSLPELMILKRVMKIKLIIIFALIVGIGIIFTGYLFNLILR